jgi:hypothetical protein
MAAYGNYVETDILTARNIIAFRREETNTHIQPGSAPVIGSSGHLKWMSSLEFISSMTEFSPVYDIQPGLSTLIQNVLTDKDKIIQSTVTGLSKSSYINSLGLSRDMGTLTYTHGYISSSALYDCINSLTSLKSITESVGPMVKFVRSRGERFDDRAFIKTANPGSYRIYSSTLSMQGSNLRNTAINNSGVTTSGIIDIGGYRDLIIPGISKMRIDVNIGLEHTTAGKFSTFLLRAGASEAIGTPVVVDYLTPPTAPIGKITYFLTAADLIGRPSMLNIGHRGDVTNATTAIPSFGGIHVTLNNMD